MPIPAGVQTLKKGAFQVPAQPKPVGEMSSTLGSLEVKVNVGAMFEFALFWALALKKRVFPN
jgi:hypothetical protein